MKRLLMVMFLTAILLLATGCAKKEEEVQPQLVPPVEPPAPVPEIEEVEEPEPEMLVPDEQEPIEEKIDILEEWHIPDQAISGMACDTASESLSFTFTNTGTKTWELGTILPFPPPKDRASVKLIINGYEVTARETDYFGDGGFPENCEGAKSLAPDESVLCNLKPIPIIKENDFSRNTILVQGSNVNFQERFYCE